MWLKYCLYVLILIIVTIALGSSFFNIEITISTLFQIIEVFIPISLIIPSFVLSLAVPYFLSLHTALHSEVHQIANLNKNAKEDLKICAAESIQKVDKFRDKIMAPLLVLTIYSFIGAALGIITLLGAYRWTYWFFCKQRLSGIIIWWLGIELIFLFATLGVGYKYYPLSDLIKLQKATLGEEKIQNWEKMKKRRQKMKKKS